MGTRAMLNRLVSFTGNVFAPVIGAVIGSILIWMPDLVGLTEDMIFLGITILVLSIALAGLVIVDRRHNHEG